MRGSWHLVTGEFGHGGGGVATYTADLAAALTACGDVVRAWASSPGEVFHDVEQTGFSPLQLAALARRIQLSPAPRRIVIQYVPHAFGLKGMNLALPAFALLQGVGEVWVMFHEVAFPWGRHQSVSHNVLGAVNRVMAATLVASARQILVSTPAWSPLLRQLSLGRARPIWLPIPSGLEGHPHVVAAQAGRAPDADGQPGAPVVGHFGTYGQPIASVLEPVLVGLLDRHPTARIRLVGRGSRVFARRLLERRPGMRERVDATGALPLDEIAPRVRGCDVLVQPYPDGVTTRRTSLSAGLALGLPVVTNAGPLTESGFWLEAGAVALVPAPDPQALVSTVIGVLEDPSARRRLGVAAARFYDEHMSMRHTCNSLRSLAAEDHPGAAGG